MAASNNKKHFGSIDKEIGDYASFLYQYTEEELIVALLYMVEGSDNPPPLETILERAAIVGNLPRYLVSIKKFIARQR
jgi:hypothetical protein